MSLGTRVIRKNTRFKLSRPISDQIAFREQSAVTLARTEFELFVFERDRGFEGVCLGVSVVFNLA